MEVDGEEGPFEGAPSSGALQVQPRSQGKPPAFFISKAEEYLSSFPPNMELAVKFLEKGVSVHPNHVGLLERLAAEYAEIGRAEEAKKLLQRAMELQPDSGPLKFLQMAQLEEGAASLPLYSKAIDMLESAARVGPRSSSSSSKSSSSSGAAAEFSQKEARAHLVRAYAAVAELYLTDLCDEAEAEAAAANAINKALLLDPDSPDALLCEAQFKKVKEDREGAMAAAGRLHAVLKRLQEKAAAGLLLWQREHGAAAAAAADGQEEENASIEIRVNAGRLFIDLEMVEEALEVLSSCLEENEDDPEVWLVYCCGLLKAKEFDSCLSALDELKDRLKRFGFPSDHPMAEHEEELRKLAEQGLTDPQQQQQQQQQQDSSDCSFSSDDEGAS